MKGKIVWQYLLILPLALCAGYFFRLILKEGMASKVPINHGLILLSGLGLVFLWSVLVNTMVNSFIYKGRPWWMKIFSFFGWLTMIPVIFGTFMCLMEGAGMLSAMQIDASATERAFAAQKQLLMLKIYSFSLLYGILCFACFWTRFYVQEGSVVIKDGKVYYPGESYILTPFYIPDLERLPQDYEVPEFALKLKCDDGEFEVKIEPKVKLLFGKSLGERVLDLEKFHQKLKASVVDYILDYARCGTLGAFFSSKLLMEISVLGIPVVWDGKANYTLIQE
jgi:hypothetical protein